MRKLAIVDTEIMQLALQQEILRSEEARYDHRLHGVLLVAHGFSCYTVAGLLGQDPRTIERWVQRFETRGFAGLHKGDGSGRPRRLDAAQWDAMNRELRRTPRESGYSQNLWDGKLLAHHLAQVHGVALGLRQCQRLFRQVEFRLRKPRPLIAHADPAAQAAYIKTADSPATTGATSGTWTNAISSSMAPAASCGCTPRRGIPCCSMRRRGSP